MLISAIVVTRPEAGMSGGEKDTRVNGELAVFLANQFFLTSGTTAPILPDHEAGIDAGLNLILIGTPSSHVLMQYLSLPVVLPPDRHEKWFQLGRCRFGGKQDGVLFLAPRGKAGLQLVLTGNSVAAVRNVVRMATPTIPPMARSPFSNGIPDFLVRAGCLGHSTSITAMAPSLCRLG